MDLRHAAKAHLLPHFTKGTAWRDGDVLMIDRGEGCYVWDTNGVRYLDGLSGLFCTNLGHGRADLVSAASEQMSKLAFYPNWGFAHAPGAEAAERIAAVAPGDLDETFFVSSGSEAVEAAIKFARNYHVSRGESSRYKVIARNWAYHGTTLGALAVTGIPKFRQTFLPNLWDGVRHVPNTFGCAVEPGTDASELECVQAIEAQIQIEGPETIAMLIAEPVQNGRGAVVPPEGYWQQLRAICDRYGILLCADEVLSSFGRLGHWFGSERFGVIPDMITFAKGVTSAYVPLGGLIVRKPLVDEIWDSDTGLFNHGSTFGGHPVATAVAVATIKALETEAIPSNVLSLEGHLREGLEKLAIEHPTVLEVRGTGFFYAVELVADRETGRELSADQVTALQGGELQRYLREARLLIRPDDRGATMLTISPPLVSDTDVLDDLLHRMDQVLCHVDAFVR